MVSCQRHSDLCQTLEGSYTAPMYILRNGILCSWVSSLVCFVVLEGIEILTGGLMGSIFS